MCSECRNIIDKLKIEKIIEIILTIFNFWNNFSTKRDTYYLLVRFTPLADPSTELLGFVSASGGSLRFSI